jgi:hypothetical protein
MLKLTKGGDCFVNRFFAHGATVDHNHVGIRWFIGFGHPAFREERSHAFGIRHVHLATEGSDKVFLVSWVGHFDANLYLKKGCTTTSYYLFWSPPTGKFMFRYVS